MVLFDELQDLMAKHSFTPQKKLSQFFCINDSLLEFMVEKANLEKKDSVLEIGAGTGFLTKKLLEKCNVIAIEKSEVMCEVLSNKFADEIAAGKLKLICGDVLEQNFSELNADKCVALPPYHISSKLVAKIVESKIQKAVLMLDNGFVNKLTAFEGFAEYGSLSALANLNSEINILKQNVQGKEFFPSPGCQSAIVEMDFNRKNISSEFVLFLKELFRHKNKNLSRALKQTRPFLENELKLPKGFEKKIEALELRDVKVNQLEPSELLEIFKSLCSK
ncbi:MAG: rRNA adenine dimethyltransferase family protein [archaeon]|jgi:16S rRNA (adenine1518-N6/adenine1519-N6)-dimethyltransferase